ncbi:unnamed protein product [Musa hybrid cultivar]
MSIPFHCTLMEGRRKRENNIHSSCKRKAKLVLFFLAVCHEYSSSLVLCINLEENFQAITLAANIDNWTVALVQESRKRSKRVNCTIVEHQKKLQQKHPNQW